MFCQQTTTDIRPGPTLDKFTQNLYYPSRVQKKTIPPKPHWEMGRVGRYFCVYVED